MSDFGIFEADEAAQRNPQAQARTAARKMTAAIDAVRADFGRFLIAATGIDEFEDRWHYSKHDIRRAIEPLVFPNTGTMRRVHNALKQDWKLAHPYKLALDHDEAGYGQMSTQNTRQNQDLDETYHPSSGNLIPEGDFAGYKDSVDQDGPEKVSDHVFTPGGDSGSDRRAAKTEWKKVNNDGYPAGADGGNMTKAERDAYNAEEDKKHGLDREAARLVADIYTDFARANGMRVASLDTLDRYASTGIHDADYRLLQSMIIRAAEDCSEECDDDEDTESEDSDSETDSEAPKASESDDSDSDDDSDDAPDFGGEDAAEDDSDDESESDDDSDDYSFGDDTDADGDHDHADHHDDDGEDYDFGGGDEGGDVGQTFTVPEHAPELPPEMMAEIPQDDANGSAPVPPEVIDSLLGLPEGTIEQLLLEEAEQGQGGDPGMSGPPAPPQGGGDDFFGGGGGDPEKEPPRVARRRQSVRRTALEDGETPTLGPLQGPMDLGYGDADFPESLRPRSEDDLDMPMVDKLTQQYHDDPFRKYGPELDPAAGHAGFGEFSRFGPDQWDYDAINRMTDSRQEHERGRTSRRRSARSFWAAEGEQEQESEGGGGEQAAPAQDPAAAMGGQMGMDPSAMMGQMGGGMLPPPGSQAIQPPAPPAPMENQPAEDALLDTANQAIMQMIDRETQEYQQIIDPLSQALQAIQFAQQVEQTEHPMDVTPPQGTVDVSPAQAPGGAANPQQQLARLLRQAKKTSALHNAAALISRTYGMPQRVLREAMGRRNYEHAAEAFHILPDHVRTLPETRAAARHIGEMFAAENPRFNKDVWLRTVLASNPRDRAGDAWRDGRDRGIAEHGRHDMDDYGDEGPLVSSSEPWQGFGDQGHPQASDVPWSERHRIRGGSASRGRLPFDRPRRTAGETWMHTPTMDVFEHPNAGEVPRVDDGNDFNNLPVMPGADPHGKNAASSRAIDKFQRWKLWRQKNGLPATDGEASIHNFLQTRRPGKSKVGDEAAAMIHRDQGLNPDAAKPVKAKPMKAINPTLKAKPPATKTKAAPAKAAPKTASFFTRRVPGWKWDDHLSGYVSKEARRFTCSCGDPVDAPSYKTCKCGKIWNVYAIGDTHHLASDSADMFIAREIPVRDNVIMANKKMAGDGFGYDPANPDHDGEWSSGHQSLPGDPTPEDYERAHSWKNQLSDEHREWFYDDDEAADKDFENYSRDPGKYRPLDLPSERLPHQGWNPDDKQDPFDPRLIGASRRLAGGGSPSIHDHIVDIDRTGLPRWLTNRDDRKRAKAFIGLGDHEGLADHLALVAYNQYMNAQSKDPMSDESESWMSRSHQADSYLDALSGDGRTAAKTAKDGGCTCWEGYERVPGTEPCASKSCRKKTSAKTHRELVAEIERLADWTKYDGEDPVAKAYGKPKPPSTSVAKPPQDWAKRKPKGDPSKRGGTWESPPIAPKKK
jgi:hypothetical protein